MEFLRYCKNHFKYKIYKILLYGIIAFILLSLVGCKEVNAESGIASANGQKFLTSFSGTFADNTNDVLTRITAGFDENNVRYYSDPITLTGKTTYGAAVIFDTLEPFVAGYTYSVSILIGNNYEIGVQPTSNRICVAETLNNSITRYNNPSTFSCTNAISTTYTTGKANSFYIENSSTGNLLKYHILTYIFTPDFTGTSVGFVFNTTNNTSMTYTLYFGGYIQTLLSDNKNLSQSQITSAVQNSGLATASSIEEVQTSISEVQEEMAKQSEEQSKTNEKLDDLNDSITSESENFEDSSCGIICKLGKIPGKIIDGLLDGLKSLFIPEDGYFESWFNDLKAFFEKKLGFLATPFTIVIDFINKYLELDSTNDIIINIPNITVPNFEDHIIIEKTTLNWSDLLKSKESLNSLWQLYLAFVDVFLILNFIGLCETKYNRIFGGDTSNYEYYTVEDSISYDGQTGEVISQRQNERRTTRKKV